MPVSRIPAQRTQTLHPTDPDIRCLCRNLLGRTMPHGIEVKCRRCKRIHVIPLSILDELHLRPQ